LKRQNIEKESFKGIMDTIVQMGEFLNEKKKNSQANG